MDIGKNYINGAENGNIETAFMVTKSLGFAFVKLMKLTKIITINSFIGSNKIFGYLMKRLNILTNRNADDSKKKSNIL